MMTSPVDPRSEERLQALFDRTAEQPTGAQLTKLAARAAEVPLRARARAWWLVWIAGPTLAAAAVVGLVVGRPSGGNEAPQAVAASVSPRLAPPDLSEGASAEQSPALPSIDDLSMGATAMFSMESDEFDPLGGSLDGPASDDELDAWLAAAEEILGGG